MIRVKVSLLWINECTDPIYYMCSNDVGQPDNMSTPHTALRPIVEPHSLPLISPTLLRLPVDIPDFRSR